LFVARTPPARDEQEGLGKTWTALDGGFDPDCSARCHEKFRGSAISGRVVGREPGTARWFSARRRDRRQEARWVPLLSASSGGLLGERMSVSASAIKAAGRRRRGKQADLDAAFERAAELAADWITQTTLSPFTQDGYKRSIGSWLTWCRDIQIDPLLATSDDVARYRDELRPPEGQTEQPAGRHGEDEPREPLAPATVRFHLSAIAAFYRWARQQPDVEEVTTNPADWVKRPPRPDRAQAEWLSRIDALRYLDAARREGPRAHALAGMFLFYGQPTSGIAHLVGADVHRRGQDGPTIQTYGRRGVRKTVRLVEPILSDVLELAHAAGPNGALFPGQRTIAAGRHAIAAEIASINRRAQDPVLDGKGKRLHITPRLLVGTMLMAASRGGASAIDVIELTGFDTIQFTATQARAGLQAAECVVEYLHSGESLLPTGAPPERDPDEAQSQLDDLARYTPDVATTA